MDHLIARSELTDVTAWTDMFAAAPADFAANHRLRATPVDGAVVLSSTGLPLGHFNSMIGLGVLSPYGRGA